MYVYCLSTCAVQWQGRVLHLDKGIPWRADDPFVKARPDMFSRTPPITGATVESPVETVTAAPGEKRRLRG